MYTSTDLVVHRSRFYVAELYSINSIAYNKDDCKVALLRRRIRKYQPSQNEMHSVIEIWNFQNKASFLEQVIHDDPDNLTLLEDITWSHKGGRLFSCGLNTYVNEYDMESGRIKQSHCVNSSPAWCLAINNDDSLLAIGTEDGYICIYRISDGSFQYEKILDRNDNRILCIDWYHPPSSSPLLIAGTIDFIKIWNYEKGRQTDFIKVGNTGVVVWCLKVLTDLTIVSGDSTGTTSFWNGKNATLNASFKAHKADVLSVCCTDNEQNVYSAGVDPAIIKFGRNFNKSDSWVMSVSRRTHSHDVRSLVYINNWLLSGGVDSQLVQTSFTPNLQVSHISKYSNRFFTVSNSSGDYICIQYEKFLQIWKLGAPESDLPEHLAPTNTVQVTPLKLVDNAIKLLEVSSRKAIIAAAFNSEWIIYANYSNIKVISWTENSIEKVKVLHDPISNVTNICMTSDNSFALSHGRCLETFKLDKFGILSENSKLLATRIHLILVHEDKLIVSLADKENTISILNTSTLEQLTYFTNVLIPSTMKVNYSDAKLWVAFSNSMLLEYDLENLALTKMHSLSQYKSNESNECRDFNEHWPIKQIAFGENIVLFSNDHNLYGFQARKNQITKCDKYRSIFYMNNVSTNKLVIVEVTPEMLLNMLPPTLKAKSFGT